MIKKAFPVLGIGLITLTANQLHILAKPPQQTVIRQSGKVKAEVSSIKVVNHDKSQGWSNFDGLADVTLQLTISRDGKTKLTDRHEVTYRYGDLPQELKLIELDGDKEPEVLATYQSQLGSGAHSNTFSYIYKYQPQKSTYQKTEVSWANFGYKIKDLDKNHIPEFVSYDNRFKETLGLCTYCVSPPIQIWQYQKGKMVDVTRRYPKAIRSNAYTIWQYFEKARNDNSGEQALKGHLVGYLANKYLLGESEDGWQRVKQAYQGSDRDSFFSDLMDLLRSNDYVRTASNAAKPLNTDKQARSNKPIASVLRPFLPRLKQGTQLPIFLPSHLPIKNIYACLDIINTNEYMVNIGSIGGDGQKDCSPSTAAYVGSISAFRGEKIQEPTQKVRLSNNISAYYAPRSYKVPPSIYWTYKNVLYQINMKEYADGKDRNPAEAKAYLIKLANSAIEAGQR